MRIFPGIDTLMRDLKLATMRMEMRGEMMKVRAEAMIKRGEMLNRYGEGLENARAE